MIKENKSNKGIGNNFIDDLESLYVNQVLRSRHLFRFSEFSSRSFSSRFEERVGKMYDNSHCLLFPSATMALLAFLKFLKLPKGSEVIVSPFGWVANYSVLRLEGLKLVFTPLDHDLNIDPEEVRKRITKRTKIILVAHLLGRQQKYIKEISGIARKNDIYLVEDIAQSFGVGQKGLMAGNYGDFTYCSLNRFKIVSTGDGGFGMTKNKNIFHGIQTMHDQGCVIDNGRRKIPNDPKEGLSMRVNELTAAVAYAQLMKFSDIRKEVKKVYGEVKKIVKDIIQDKEEIIPEKGDTPYFYLFRSKQINNYPSLLDSGWHCAGNIPYLKREFTKQKRNDKKLTETENILSETFSIGSGLIQEYLATPIGLGVNFNDQEKKSFIKNLKKIAVY